MAMTSGSQADLNVTPLIDVLLVLLIIFMVIIPVKPVGEQALLPEQAANPVTSEQKDPIVLELVDNGSAEPRVLINKEAHQWPALHDDLERIYLHRGQKVMFIRADDSLDFEPVAHAIDIAHAAGVTSVALMTQREPQ